MASHRNWRYEDEDEEIVADAGATEENGRANRAIFLIFGALLLLVGAMMAGIALFGERDAEAGEAVAGSSGTADRQISNVVVNPAAAQPAVTAQGTLTPEQVILQMTAGAPINATTNEDIVVVEPVIPVVSLTTVPRPPFSVETPPSIVSGILHGMISPFTFILSLITPTIRMYDPTNAGFMYDIGFLIGFVILAALVRWFYLNRRAPRRRRKAS